MNEPTTVADHIREAQRLLQLANRPDTPAAQQEAYAHRAAAHIATARELREAAELVHDNRWAAAQTTGLSELLSNKTGGR
ncbi:hypothetical protein [Streptomyces sp. RPT161]|uniref:hypothetical protein n=1 Tax=Streptomyces sp. RPT161 TaxID=3015993 RepID=UPI0022B88F5F|nr:hypothetical protein [Streptomyces sp. RPT161]